jgi:hypothetical protein
MSREVFKAEFLDTRTIVLTYDPLITVSFRIRKSTLDRLDKLVVALQLDKRLFNNNVRISRTYLIRRIIERVVENPHILNEIL